MNIREAHENDVIGIVYVQATTWIAHYPNRALSITEDDIRNIDWHGKVPHWQHLIKSSDYRVWVAAEGEYIRGFTAVSFSSSGHELYELNVLPEYQNQGIGSALLETVLNQFGEDILLQLATYNQAAERLYERYGFTRTGTHGAYKLPGGKTIPTMHMRRSHSNDPDEAPATLVTRKQLAEASGLRESTIKWYTEQGLLPYTQQDAGRRRYYRAEEAQERLRYIQQLQEQGLSLKAIQDKLQ